MEGALHSSSLCFQTAATSRASEPARPPPPPAGASAAAAAAAAALGPSTTEDELNALLSQIDQVHKLIMKLTRELSLFHASPRKNQEISLDPELAEDLLDILVKKTTVCNKHQSIDKGESDFFFSFKISGGRGGGPAGGHGGHHAKRGGGGKGRRRSWRIRYFFLSSFVSPCYY